MSPPVALALPPTFTRRDDTLSTLNTGIRVATMIVELARGTSNDVEVVPSENFLANKHQPRHSNVEEGGPRNDLKIRHGWMMDESPLEVCLVTCYVSTFLVFQALRIKGKACVPTEEMEHGSSDKVQHKTRQDKAQHKAREGSVQKISSFLSLPLPPLFLPLFFLAHEV
jgi:hypothetical protein